MSKEEYIDNIVKSITLDVRRKDFLTYKEQYGWKDYITDIVDRIVQQENQKYKEVIDKAINDLNIIIDIIQELPLGSDCWIIDRLEANKSILKEVSE